MRWADKGAGEERDTLARFNGVSDDGPIKVRVLRLRLFMRDVLCCTRAGRPVTCDQESAHRRDALRGLQAGSHQVF